MTTSHRNWRAILLDTALFGLVFGLTNVVSYLFIVVAGRSLLPTEFGVFNVFLGLLTLGGVFATSLQVAVTRAVDERATRATLQSLVRDTSRLALPFTLLLTVGALPFASQIGASPAQIALCGATLFATILSSTALGFLVGLGKVRSPADLNFFGAVARFAAGWALMLAGLGIDGALAGYAVNYFLVFVFAYVMGLRVSKGHMAIRTTGHPRIHVEGSTVAIFVVAFFPFTMDQLLVQLFNPALGGDYAAMATVAKLTFFAAYPITAVAYPNLLARSDFRSRMWALATASTGILLITGSLAWLINAFPHQLLQVFFGNRFSAAGDQLGSLAIGAACFSLSALGVHAQIAWGGRAGFVPSFVASCFGVVLFALHHDGLAAVVTNQVWTYALQLILVWGLLAITVARSRSLKGVGATTASCKS